MKIFLKVLVIGLLVVIALKLCPLVLLAAVVGLGVAGVIGFLGLSLLAVALLVAGVLAAILSPIWVPVLLIAGVVALVGRRSRGTVAG